MKTEKQGRISKKKLIQQAHEIERGIGLRWISFMLRLETDMLMLERIGGQIGLMNERKRRLSKRPKNARNDKKTNSNIDRH